KGSSVRSGDFAFGYSFRYPMAFQARVFLEGAWRNNGMTNDLQVKNLIPQTPPDVFPYNRDPERAKIIVSQIPDSVVDWVVVEFRRTLNDLRPIVYTAFLKTDGRIVGRNGEFPISDANVKFDTGVSSYYVAILHRNHLAIVTEEKIDLIRKPIMAIIDFSKPEIVMGRENALKPLARTREGILFGMLAGEVNGDGLIDNFDQDRIWIERDFEGYILWDVNLDGIVTTRDLNYSINNRGRRSFVP
ncbi:MAG: hypothetical protein N2517_09085, partial [Ignavibacteria bacterium]|nr:hypothetical protein [Ignavibacteria bacterium]